MIARAIWYNRIEIFFIVSFILMQSQGEIWPVALWSGLGISAWWVLMTGTHEAQSHAKEMVYHKSLLLQDTVVGMLLLLLLAYIVRAEVWYFPVMFLLAAAQHLRYTVLIRGWILENAKKDTNNNL